MQQQLLKLLQERNITHPSKIVSATIKANCELSIVVEGFPWWKADATVGEDDRIEFLFYDVSDGALIISDIAHNWPEWDEALECFEISDTAQYSWAEIDGYELFCSKPLKYPLDLFAALDDWLTSERSVYDARYYLNFGHSDGFDLYLKYASCSSYLLARAPKKVSDFIVKQLELQDVPVRMSSTKLASCGALLVRIGDSHFLCEKAIARFDE